MSRPESAATERGTAIPHGPIAHPDPTRHPHPEPIILDIATEFIGCLLHSTADQAAPLLDLVHDDDMPTALEQHVLTLIRDLVGRGVAPRCSTVLHHALTTGTLMDQRHREALTGYRLDAFAGSPLGSVNGPWLAAGVLENAYRRAGAEYATRILQNVETGGIEAFERALSDREQLRSLWRRVRLAHDDDGIITDESAVTIAREAGVA